MAIPENGSWRSSLLHLCGYDHMEDAEREVMETRQREILAGEGYHR